jgi:hypothetical protein
MITDKQIKALIDKAHQIAIDTLKPKEKIDEIFFNLKAHLQADKKVEDVIRLTNELLIKHGEATIKCALVDNGVLLTVGKTTLAPIPKHFDFDLDDLYYTTLDFFSQIYEDSDFATSLVFLCEDRTKAELHVTL